MIRGSGGGLDFNTTDEKLTVAELVLWFICKLFKELVNKNKNDNCILLCLKLKKLQYFIIGLENVLSCGYNSQSEEILAIIEYCVHLDKDTMTQILRF